MTPSGDGIVRRETNGRVALVFNKRHIIGFMTVLLVVAPGVFAGGRFYERFSKLETDYTIHVAETRPLVAEFRLTQQAVADLRSTNLVLVDEVKRMRTTLDQLIGESHGLGGRK